MDGRNKLLLLLIFTAVHIYSFELSTVSKDSDISWDNRIACRSLRDLSRNNTEVDDCQPGIEICLCNNSCIDHGDCFRNIQIKGDIKDIYINGKCAKDWDDLKVETLCSMALPFSTSETANRDPFLDTPVTSNRTKVTYSNYYCAICNDETPFDIQIWYSVVDCNQNTSAMGEVHLNETNILENLQYVSNSWGVYLNKSGKSSFHSCSLYPDLPPSTTYSLHYCKDHIDECPPSWKDLEVKNMCNSYTNIARDKKSNILYKNIHCAICNFSEVIDLDCDRTIITRFGFAPRPGFSFSAIINYSVKSECPLGSIWDELSNPKQCRPVICHKKHSKYKYGSCIQVNEHQSNLNSIETSTWNLTSCNRKYFYNITEVTIGLSQIIHINASGKSYEKDEYELYENGVYVCVPSNYSTVMGWISLLGLVVSSICLLLHLIVFAIIPDLRNISGMNMASLCLSLLVAFVCLIITAYQESAIVSCPLLASLSYYFFLSSFMWMNVMAFDIWLTVRNSTTNFQVSSGHQWKKFVIYSLYAWIIPGIALAIVLTIDHLKNLPPEYLPEFGESLCWFGQNKAIFVYFAAPLAVIMTANVIFFLMTIRKITETSKSTKHISTVNPQRKQLILYVRLAVVMGLSWVVGIVSGFFQISYLHYLFIILNAFQGLYILLAYTCTSKVRRALKNLKKLNLVKDSQGDLMPVSDTMAQMNIVDQDNKDRYALTATTNLGSTTTICSSSSMT